MKYFTHFHVWSAVSGILPMTLTYENNDVINNFKRFNITGKSCKKLEPFDT